MPGMPRPNNKATRITYGIIGVPMNMRDTQDLNRRSKTRKVVQTMLVPPENNFVYGTKR